MRERYLQKQVERDLSRKMVFVGGPRQVGKTTLAQRLLKKGTKLGYLNWDSAEDRERILRRKLPSSKLWIFDELHKYRQWRNYLKGLYDSKAGNQRILVTGSARLDYYRFSGDSLQGRYHYLRLHPLSSRELDLKKTKELKTLLKLGGFPEPFFGQSQLLAKRWSRDYRNRLLREELTELERVSDLGQMELLMLRLPELVGSPLSINALRQDLQLNYKTVSRWVDILERIYGIFRISPFGAPKIRAVKKEQKHYHFDWSVVEELPLRFENMVAVHLLKWVHFIQDTRGEDLELRYFRDVDGREVDFVIVDKKTPIAFIECKWKNKDVSKSLKYLKARFPSADAWQIALEGTQDYQTPEGIRVSPALELLNTLV